MTIFLEMRLNRSLNLDWDFFSPDYCATLLHRINYKFPVVAFCDTHPLQMCCCGLEVKDRSGKIGV